MGKDGGEVTADDQVEGGQERRVQESDEERGKVCKALPWTKGVAQGAGLSTTCQREKGC